MAGSRDNSFSTDNGGGASGAERGATEGWREGERAYINKLLNKRGDFLGLLPDEGSENDCARREN